MKKIANLNKIKQKKKINHKNSAGFTPLEVLDRFLLTFLISDTTYE